MRVVIAPSFFADSFAGSLTASRAAEAIAVGWRQTAPEDELVPAPPSDGGRGLLDVVAFRRGGELLAVTVPGPLGVDVPAAVPGGVRHARPTRPGECAVDLGGHDEMSGHGRAGLCDHGNVPAPRPVHHRETRHDHHGSFHMTVQDQTQQGGIVLTDTAAAKVKALLEQEGREDLSLRVAVQPGGCSGLRYQLFFDERELDGDVVSDFGGVNVVVDRMSSPYLGGATIDFVDTIEKQGFTIDNPNAGGSCACGDSFH